jgi:hypothetical protein
VLLADGVVVVAGHRLERRDVLVEKVGQTVDDPVHHLGPVEQGVVLRPVQRLDVRVEFLCSLGASGPVFDRR